MTVKSKEQVIKQLNKTNDTVYEFDKISVNISSNCFVNIKNSAVEFLIYKFFIINSYLSFFVKPLLKLYYIYEPVSLCL